MKALADAGDRKTGLQKKLARLGKVCDVMLLLQLHPYYARTVAGRDRGFPLRFGVHHWQHPNGTLFHGNASCINLLGCQCDP